MDLNALMQAAMQDPKAAAFLQQMLAGGTPMGQRLPKIAPQELRVPKIVAPKEGGSPLSVFDQAQSSVDDLLKKWGPGAAEQQPGGFQPQPMDVSGMPATSLGGGMIEQMEQPQGPQQGPPIPPVDPITQTTLPPPGQEQGDDLISLLGRVLGRGGA